MRSAAILAALAVGTCAKLVHKEVYTTEWTTVTVTETVTQWPTHAPSAVVVNSEPASTLQPVETPAPTVDLSKKTGVAAETAPAEVKSKPAPAEVKSEAAPAEVKSAAPAVEAESKAPAATTSVTAPATSSVEPVQAVTSSATSLATSASTTTAAAAATSAVSTSSTASAGGSYQESLLSNHNIHRSTHGADALTWSDSLTESAKTLAMRCVYEHDTSIGERQYGQNIGYGIEQSKVGEQIISQMMYSDEEPLFSGLYGQANPDMTNFLDWGHFTQIVWKDTREVGCYTYTCASLKEGESSIPNSPFTVCNYFPAGNYEGEYADNVAPPS
ncbi:Ves allergen [Penicillium paradoxum]|uniref:Ves allergen n=1 Tax=Penicillium paradoxum TaxID=176176 RepID=UPI002548B2E3|nr:Ves allergen [Penicillium paradoxum]KAJ5793996.1 Ves allergen [Penicillium paradoxum]